MPKIEDSTSPELMPVDKDVNRQSNVSIDVSARPIYLSALNVVTHPHDQLATSRYFVERWLPRLGPDRWALIVTLRSLASTRNSDGTASGTFTAEILAERLGVSSKTVYRLLASKAVPG